MDEVMMQQWAVGMATLLDKIEKVADDEDAVLNLCHQRFAMAEECGLEIKWLGPTHGEEIVQ